MKLLYFAIRNFNYKKGWQEFNLDANWHFFLAGKSKTLSLNVKHEDTLPDNFFNLASSESFSPVESVSAIIGANGSGKTSFASALSVIFSLKQSKFGDSSVIDNFSHEDYVIVAEFGKSIDYGSSNKPKEGVRKIFTLISNRDVKFDNDGVVLIKRKGYYIQEGDSQLSDIATMVYHSPIFSFYNTINEREFSVKDISTTRIMSFEDEDLESIDATGYRVEGRARVFLEENMRIILFLKAIVRKRRESKISIEMPYPREVVISGDSKAVEHIQESFPKIWRNNADIKWLLGIHDLFARMLFIFVLDSLSEPMAPVPHQYEFPNNVVESRVTSIFTKLARSLQKNNPLTTGLVPFFESFSALNEKFPSSCVQAYSTVMNDVKALCVDIEGGGKIASGLFMNDRSLESFKAGIEMFSYIEDRIQSNSNEYVSGALHVPLKDDGSIEMIGRVIEMHAKCKLGWSVSYLHFSFGMSAGEMSFLSLFSRLHYYYSWLNNECGKGQWEPNQILFLDESETTLHPQLQRNLVSYLIEFYETFFPEVRVHIIFATHSPILLSDIPKGNCCFLDDVNDNTAIENTFGANIFDLYRVPFNLKTGTVGKFASKKIDDALAGLANFVNKRMNTRYDMPPKAKLKETLEPNLYKTLKMVGDPMVKALILDLKEGELI